MIKLDLVIGKIIEIKDHPNADKLFIEKIDVGDNVKQVISGLKGHYEKEDLLNKKVVIVNNLKPAKLRGEISEGMLLAIEQEGKVEVIETQLKEGTKLSFENQTSNEQISIEEFFKHEILFDEDLKVNGSIVNPSKSLKTKSSFKGKVR
jgi:methionyl-tRNA synthetase